MGGGNIFALRMSNPEPQEVLPWDGVQFRDGWRSLMTVTDILANVQTTVFFGVSLYMIWYNIGSLSPQEGFSFFLKPLYNKPLYCAQLTQPPYAAVPAQYRVLQSTPPPPPPTAVGICTILNSGYYPLRGYWIELAGNYFLTMPIFKDWPDVKRGGPNFTGFQPSQNNPGSGGPGGSNSGGQC